jgi:hypothetical protein
LAIRRRRATLQAVLTSLLVGLSCVSAPPEPGAGHPIEIGWQAPAACPDADWARAKIERFVGDALGQTRATQLSFDVRLDADPTQGWTASIVTTTEGGRRRRTLSHSECERLSEAAALIIAMAIDPAAIDAADESTLGAMASAKTTEEEPTPAPEDPPEPTPTPADDPDPLPDPLPAPSEPRTPPATPPGRFADRWAGPRIGFDAGFGRLPTVDLGGTAGATLGVGPLRFELLAGAWAPRTVVVRGDSEARFFAWAVALRGGWAFPVGRRVELPLLVGVDLGQVRAQGRALDAAASATPPMGHAHLVPSVVVWVHPNLGVTAEVDAALPWARPAFTVAGRGTVFRAPVAGLHGGIGLVARFPRRPPSP